MTSPITFSDLALDASLRPGLDALDHLADRLGLIAGRLEAGDELKLRHDRSSVTRRHGERQSLELRAGAVAAHNRGGYNSGPFMQPLAGVAASQPSPLRDRRNHESVLRRRNGAARPDPGPE